MICGIVLSAGCWLLGFRPKDVQVIAGHAQFQTTMDIYAHVMPGANCEAASKVEKMFGQ